MHQEKFAQFRKSSLLIISYDQLQIFQKPNITRSQKTLLNPFHIYYL